jgi:adenylate cyclase
MVETLDPGVIVSELNDIYTAFDRIGEQFGCERIKTIGDVYVTVAGVPDPSTTTPAPSPMPRCASCATSPSATTAIPNAWRGRIGAASGAVIGSVVGVQKYIYDVFGPAVTLAQRLRLVAEPMTICADAALAALCSTNRFELTPLGRRELGGGAARLWRMGEAARAGRAMPWLRDRSRSRRRTRPEGGARSCSPTRSRRCGRVSRCSTRRAPRALQRGASAR